MAFSNVTSTRSAKGAVLALGLFAVAGCGGTTTGITTAPPSNGGTKSSQGTQGTQITQPSTPQIDLLNTSAVSSAVSVLMLDTGTNTTSVGAGTFDHAAAQVSTNGNSYGITPNTNRYVAFINGGGDNRIVALESPASAVSGGGASYAGKANMEYVDTPSGNTFRGTLDATITADFDAGNVNIDLINPVGTLGGAAYAGAGRVDIDNLAISGARYGSGGASSASITGFTGATGLNSGAQTVNASGVFGGPNAEETGATAVIEDGANGLAVLDLIGSR